MKCKYVFLSSYILSFVLLLLRTFTTFRLINPSTGMFYSHGFETFFYFLLPVFLMLFLSASIFLKRYPLKAPKVRLPLFIASIVLLLSLLIDALFDDVPTDISGHFIQNVLVVTTILFALFIIGYFLTFIFCFKINPILYCIPLIFWLTKLIAEYIKTAKMPFIMESGYKIIATAFICLFFLYFAKYESRILSKNSHRIIMFVGFAAAALSESFALPELAYYLKNGYIVVEGVKIVRNSVFELALYAVTGIFILVFLHSFFSNANLSKHSHHSQTKNLLPIDDVMPVSPDSNTDSSSEE